MTKEKLSPVFSEAILQVIDDVKQTFNEGLKLDLRWYRTYENNKLCFVCLAGAAFIHRDYEQVYPATNYADIDCFDYLRVGHLIGLNWPHWSDSQLSKYSELLNSDTLINYKAFCVSWNPRTGIRNSDSKYDTIEQFNEYIVWLNNLSTFFRKHGL